MTQDVSTLNGAPAILDLSDLAPERPQVRLPNGELYEMRAYADLGPVELEQILRPLPPVEGDTAEARVESARAQDTAMRERLRWIIPDLPVEAAAQLDHASIAAVFDFFTDKVIEPGISSQENRAQRRAKARQKPSGSRNRSAGKR